MLCVRAEGGGRRQQVGGKVVDAHGFINALGQRHFALALLLLHQGGGVEAVKLGVGAYAARQHHSKAKPEPPHGYISL